MYQLQFLPIICGNSSCSTFLPIHGLVILSNFIYLIKYVEETYYGFNFCFLMTNFVEHLFVCLLTICITFFLMHLFNLSPIFYWIVFLLSFKSPLYILGTNPLSDVSIRKFYPCHFLPFKTFLIVFIIGWIKYSQNLYVEANCQYLRMWYYLEIGSLKKWLS